MIFEIQVHIHRGIFESVVQYYIFLVSFSGGTYFFMANYVGDKQRHARGTNCSEKKGCRRILR